MTAICVLIGTSVVVPSAAAAAPANDSFATARMLSGAKGDAGGASVGATKEPGEPAHAGTAGGASVWFRWVAPGTGQVAFSTVDSTFDTVLAVYAGDAVDRLSAIAANDDAGYGSDSELSFTATAGTVYHVALDGFGGKSGSYWLSWTPAPANDNFGDAITLVGPSGTVPAGGAGATVEPGERPDWSSSIWFRWTAPFAGRVGFSARDGEAAMYRGEDVTDLRPVRREGPASVVERGVTYVIAVYDGGPRDELTWGGAPRNDMFARPQVIAGSAGTVRGSTQLATRERGDPSGTASVWFRWRAPAAGTYVFTTNGSSFDTLLSAWRGRSLAALRRVARDDDGGRGVASLIRVVVVAGQTYRIAVAGFEGDRGAYVLRWRRVS